MSLPFCAARHVACKHASLPLYLASCQLPDAASNCWSVSLCQAHTGDAPDLGAGDVAGDVGASECHQHQFVSEPMAADAVVA